MTAPRVDAPPTGTGPLGTGSAAAALLRRIADVPGAPLGAVVVGPGGTGKTTLLDAVERAYTDAGVAVVRTAATVPAPLPEPSTAVLVDDAHRLGDADLDRLGGLAADPAARLVVAHRPWPRPPGLTALFATAAARRFVVVVGHLDRDAVAARIAERVGVVPPAAMVDLVHEQSGGLPALVEIVTQALQGTGRFDARHPDTFHRPDLVTVSVALAERLRPRVDALEPDVRALLEAMAVGAALDGEVLAPLLATAPEALGSTVEAARSTGLLTEAGELIPFVRSLVLRLTPLLRRRELQRDLAGIELDRGGSVLAAGRQLLGTGASGSRIAAVLSAAAAEALDTSPELAVDLLADAVRAGAPPREVAGRRALALALAGNLDEALRGGDAVAVDPTAPGREDATVAAAAALAHRGLLGRSADLCRGLGPAAAVRAVPGLVVTGAVDEARAVLAAAGNAPGTLLDGAVTLLARGMLATVSATGRCAGPAALLQLARAAALLEPVAATVLLPDTPAALTAAVALQCGELSIAQGVLQRSLAQRHGGRAAQPRHRLFHAWVLMARGHVDLARRGLAEATTTTPLEPRDELMAAALAVGLARRAHDAGALASAWIRARDALVRQPVDLTTLPQLGELAVATALLGEEDWLAAHLAEADELLDRLGRPALWSVPLCWYRLQADLAAGRDEEAAAHADRLCTDTEAAPSPYGAVLAAAARCAIRVRGAQVDADHVVAVGRRMQAVGLGWEAAQLVGRAAALAGDRRATAGLHAAARALDVAEGVPQPDPEPAPDAPAPVADQAAAVPPPRASEGNRADFTERELEIGQHILAGLTYKQIGQRLYLSAKTVEHHVARMRQRLGVASRDELFGLLRAALDPETAG